MGTGGAVKICNNLLLAISMIGTSEAMNLGIKYTYSVSRGLLVKQIYFPGLVGTPSCWPPSWDQLQEGLDDYICEGDKQGSDKMLER